MEKKHLVIIDGHHLMYRAYWALPRTMKNSKGEQTNVPFGVASMLLTILKTEEPQSILFCFDEGEETFRHAEYEEYKSGRAETPDDFYEQIPRALQLIDAFAFKHASGKNHEADDYACTYARAAAKAGYRVTIVSGDRDLLQLASDAIKIAIPHKGYQAQEYLGAKEVEAKFGITPAQVPAYKGLVGDSSDNLRGVQGIGPKAAAALIAEYGTLEKIYENLPAIRESWRIKLEADREQAFFCERMATLVCDLPLLVPLKDLVVEKVDPAPVQAFFRELEFSLLLRRFESFLATPYGKAHFLSSTSQHSVSNAEGRRTAAHSAVREHGSQMMLL